MNRTPDVELVLRDYFADDGLTAPDYVLDVVEQRIGRQPRRRAGRLLWRLNPMNRTITYVAAAAAVLVVAVVGYSLLSKGPSVGTQTPVPASPSAEPLPSGERLPTMDGSPAGPVSGRLSGGRYIFPAYSGATVILTADVPAGWNWWGSEGVVIGPGVELDPPRIAVVFQVANGLYQDPCHWDLAHTARFGQRGNVVVGPAAIDLVNALQDNASYATTTPTAVVLGARQGYELEIEFPDDVTLAECDGGIVGGSHYFEIFSGADAFPYFFKEGSHMRLFIVDVEDTRVIATILYSDATPDGEREAARAIVESVEFTP